MSKRVLVVADDVEMSRKVVRKFLENEFEILEAENGYQVMDYLQQRSVDALLLDIIMPGMDGLQVLERVRADERWREIGVLVASSTKEKTERTALSLGADDVVAKPYDPIVIQKRLENILIAKKAHSQQQPGVADAAGKLEEIAASMHRLSDIIKGNMDNQQLILEAAEQLGRKANQLTVLAAAMK